MTHYLIMKALKNITVVKYYEGGIDINKTERKRKIINEPVKYVVWLWGGDLKEVCFIEILNMRVTPQFSKHIK